MNIAQYAIKHRVISWMFLLILAVGGFNAFNNLARLEDPAFTIKESMVITAYPGATAEEVEEEITYPLEQAIRQLPYVDFIVSTSSPGLSQIQVSMKMDYGADELPQIWDELRRKVSDQQPMLPPGAQPTQVMDDFGDVYGVMLLLTGEGFDYTELKQYSDVLKRELELVDGVGKIQVEGDQQEQLFVEISLKKLAALDLDFQQVIGLLNQQNAVLDAGKITINGESLYLRPGGLASNIDPIIHGRDSGQLVRLSDVADIYRGLEEIPSHLLAYNGESALSFGISFSEGVNVVEVGKRLDARIAQLELSRPAGLELHALYDQPKEVESSVNGFILSLAQAVGIVIIVLLFAMGLRSGLIIGLVLLLTMLGTFIAMDYVDIELQRISLGALIIALGMLVDNAIVVVEGILVGLKRGRTKLQASIDIVRQTAWPLLGATVISIMAFAPIGLSPDATGEFMGSLFWVLFFSLFLSWITALTLTPFLADLILPEQVAEDSDEVEDPYKGLLFVVFGTTLKWAIKHKAVTLAGMFALLIAAGVGFGQVKQAFFPPSNTPIFYLDMWLPQGTDIRTTSNNLSEVEDYLQQQEGVEFVSSTTGRGMGRFTLTYIPEHSYEAFAQMQIRMTDRDSQTALMNQIDTELADRFPQAQFQLRLMEIGPAPAAKIEARLIGPDPDVLRELADEVQHTLAQDPGARNIRHNWRERTKVLVPVINESQARRLGITNESIATTLLSANTGSQVGLYRDGTRMLPIVARLPVDERGDLESLDNLRIWSPVLQSYVPIQQVISRIDMEWQDSLIQRRDRKRTLTVMADHDILGDGTAADLFTRIQPKVEAIELPPGYELSWGGEYEAQADAEQMLFSSLPMGYLIMFIITVFLFNSLRKPLVIWLTVPLAVIGVTIGLLATNNPFSFTALLGLLSLSGMVLKNGIVLMDQINNELDSGKAAYQAVVDSAISRVRPVSMAALTTILGMIPLMADAFFASMAVTIMFGLGFATLLTLIVVPVLFATFYRITPPTAE
ncbi:efflux RND transporter permease subunit [Ferrimonas pelagia]|uniref:Multidrug efflux RND transporter permease subunit VmeV n=1 Tax=Ferrimonas pelagia TaxID=1177826 RepID=A0ABP9ENQ2_9GAMM